MRSGQLACIGNTKHVGQQVTAGRFFFCFCLGIVADHNIPQIIKPPDSWRLQSSQPCSQEIATGHIAHLCGILTKPFVKLSPKICLWNGNPLAFLEKSGK